MSTLRTGLVSINRSTSGRWMITMRARVWWVFPLFVPIWCLLAWYGFSVKDLIVSAFTMVLNLSNYSFFSRLQQKFIFFLALLLLLNLWLASFFWRSGGSSAFYLEFSGFSFCLFSNNRINSLWMIACNVCNADLKWNGIWIILLCYPLAHII